VGNKGNKDSIEREFGFRKGNRDSFSPMENQWRKIPEIVQY